MHVSAVVDRSKDKQGTELCGFKVASLQEISDDIQVIIISACFIYEDVVRAVGDKNIEVIDINRFLCIA